MCLQSYYHDEHGEIELDLLAEIKRFGIAEWQKRVVQEQAHVIRTQSADESSSSPVVTEYQHSFNPLT